MSTWNENTVEVENGDKIYQEFFNKTGTKKIDHLGLTIFGYAINSNFLSNVSIS